MEEVTDVIFFIKITANQEKFSDYGVSEGDSLLFINGVAVDADALDVFQILELLKQEEKFAAGFFSMGIKVGSLCCVFCRVRQRHFTTGIFLKSGWKLTT